MKIFITGGAGFIGSHITKQLLDQGHQITVYDNLSHSDGKNIDSRADFVKGDLADSELLVKTLPRHDAVIHMAALLEVNESVREPYLYAQNNILGSITLFEALLTTDVKKVIFSSSATVYGFPEKLPITEESPVLAVNPYGATKVAVENLLNSYHFVHKFDVTILRYFNPYGPGEDHQPETHAIPNFIKAGLNHQPIPLYWNGEQVRDFIYVEDLAAAHIAVLKLNGWNIFNVGTEKGVKMIDIVHTISDILGYQVELKDLGQRAGDVHANYASSKALKDATGWESKTDLKQGLIKTIEWFKNKK